MGQEIVSMGGWCEEGYKMERLRTGSSAWRSAVVCPRWSVGIFVLFLALFGHDEVRTLQPVVNLSFFSLSLGLSTFRRSPAAHTLAHPRPPRVQPENQFTNHRH